MVAPDPGEAALEVSRRTLMRDLEFLRDDHHASIAYDESRKGFRLGISQADKTWKVRLLFAREVATYIRERVWHPSQQTC